MLKLKNQGLQKFEGGDVDEKNASSSGFSYGPGTLPAYDGGGCAVPCTAGGSQGAAAVVAGRT